jgi:hypothetical protein
MARWRQIAAERDRELADSVTTEEAPSLTAGESAA